MMGLYPQQQTAAYVKASEVHNSAEKSKGDSFDNPSKMNKFYTRLVTADKPNTERDCMNRGYPNSKNGRCC
jgi:hypothetical protein